MEATDRSEVAELICVSLNYWLQMRGRPPGFPGGPATTDAFFEVYEALDPGCGVVAVNEKTGRLAGSCFYHPRPTHVSLGIMNVHPNYFGQGVAKALLGYIIEYADREKKPVRLVSSAMNLESFSLYTRAGFVPRCAYQDFFLRVPDEGLEHHTPGLENVREATDDDVEAMVALEMELSGIRREKDFHYFLKNSDGLWHTSVYENDQGGLDGFMVSSGHEGLNMIGPGMARTEEQALPLMLVELDRHRGGTPVFVVPVECDRIVRRMYDLGGRNYELHFGQIRGPAEPIRGVNVPTFLPESG